MMTTDTVLIADTLLLHIKIKDRRLRLLCNKLVHTHEIQHLDCLSDLTLRFLPDSLEIYPAYKLFILLLFILFHSVLKE